MKTFYIIGLHIIISKVAIIMSWLVWYSFCFVLGSLQLVKLVISPPKTFS